LPSYVYVPVNSGRQIEQL